MVPRALMFATKNRTVAIVCLLLATTFVTACTPPGPRALLEGRKLLEAGQTDAALERLKTATSLLPTNAAAWNYLGLAYHRAGQWTNAAEAYTRALRLDRELLEARFNLGCLWLDQDQWDAARGEFTAYTLRRGNAVDGWLKLGAAQLQGRDVVGAEKSFREALRLDAGSVEAMNGLGLVLLQRNRPRDAAESFGAALKEQPDYRPALLNLATVSQQYLNNRSEALRLYRAYLALQPKATDWDAVNVIVRSLEPPLVPAVSTQSVRSQPVVVTNNVVAAAPPPPTNQPKPTPTLATRPVTTPKPETTVAPTRPASAPVIEKPVTTPVAPPPEVVKLSPEPVIKAAATQPQASVARSEVAVRPTPATESVPPPKPARKGFFSKLNPFSRSETNPGTAAPKAPTEATSTVAPAARPPAVPGRYSYLSPKPPGPGNRPEAEVSFAQGQQAQRVNRMAEALPSFRRAAQLDPSYFEAYYSMGLTAFNLRSFQTALMAWEYAIALRPDNADARYNFGLTLKAADYPQDAANELEKLLALHPDEARGHLTLGNLYADELRDIPRARRHYNRVLQLDPRNPQAQAIRYWLVANPG